ncbi:MAG: hypothetical protein KDD34_04770 [Bdellovibrionales bacterium]|nr:hypothetical protein [Bdellovibrionales bacterium]
MKTRWIIGLFALFFSTPIAHAGFIELGTSANYRRSTIDSNNFQESISFTGSVAYYFWESSALELSYTEGYSQIVVTPIADSKTITETQFSLLGLDFVLSISGREDAFQPYLKMGGAVITKSIYRQIDGVTGKDKIAEQTGTVPSAGIGFKILLTKTFSIKIGVDAWTSPLNDDPVTIDYAGRAGLSWFL